MSQTVPVHVLAAFGLAPDTAIQVLHGGHINDTYLAGEKFVLQRINRFVFPHPEHIMDNMLGVSQFLREKVLARGGDPNREILQVVLTTQGAPAYISPEGEFWRCTRNIVNAASYETPDSPQMLQEAGRAFGEFQAMLAGYPAATLREIIPN